VRWEGSCTTGTAPAAALKSLHFIWRKVMGDFRRSVSVLTAAWSSSCAETEWRRTVEDPEDQTPRLYHLVRFPPPSAARRRTSIQVPSGVVAVHEGMASTKGKGSDSWRAEAGSRANPSRTATAPERRRDTR